MSVSNQGSNAISNQSFILLHSLLEADIVIDGTPAGRVAEKSYQRFVVIPGQHAIEAVAVGAKFRWSATIYCPPDEQVVIEVNFVPTDPREGKVGNWTGPDSTRYRTTEIDGKVWMAENYRGMVRGSVPAGGVEENAQAFGRLYPLDIAVGIPPQPWRLPTADDFVGLLAFYGTGAYEALSPGGISKFEFQFSGGQPFGWNAPIGINEWGALFSSTQLPARGTMGDRTLYLEKKNRTATISGGVAPRPSLYSIRFVRDV